MKVFLTMITILVLTWSCGSATSSAGGNDGGGDIPTGLFISVDGSELALEKIKGQDTNFATIETIVLPNTVNAIAFGAPAEDNQEVTYTVSLALGEPQPSVVTLGDAGTGDSNVIAFGLEEEGTAAILNVPLIKTTGLVVTMTVTDPPVSTLSALDAPAKYSIYFVVESIPRLDSLSLTYSDTDLGDIVLPLSSFDSETFTYEISTPHSLSGGTLSATAEAINPEGEVNYDVTVGDVTVSANAERIDFVASANLFINGGDQSKNYNVVVNLEKPISATRSDNGDPVVISRGGVLDYTMTANRVSQVNDLSLTFDVPVNYGGVESAVSYALTSVAGYTVDTTDANLYTKTVGEDTFSVSLGEAGVLTLPAADSADINVDVTITLDSGTPTDVSDDITYTVSVSSELSAGPSNLTVSYDDGAITFPADATTNSDIDKNYGRAAVQLVGSASTSYLVDQTSYSVSADRDSRAVILGATTFESAGYFKIEVEAVPGDTVTVSANGVAAYEIGDAGSGVYHVYYGDPRDAAGLVVNFIDPSVDTIDITVDVQRGEAPDVIETSYVITVALSDQQLVQPSSIALVYEDPARADQVTNVDVVFPNNFDSNAGSFSTTPQTFVSAGNGTIKLSVPYFTFLGGNLAGNPPLSAQDLPRFGVIGYYVNELPGATEVSAIPDGLSTDGRTFEIPLSRLDFTDANTAKFFMIAGEFATASVAPDTNTGFGVKVNPLGAATPTDATDDYYPSANVLVYEITVTLEEPAAPNFNGAVTLDYDPAGSSLFVEIPAISQIADVFANDAVSYSNLDENGDIGTPFINKDGGVLKLNSEVVNGFEVINATYNGRDLTLDQVLDGEAITVASGETSGEIVVTLREIVDISNTKTFTINIDFTEKGSVVLGDLTGLEATFTPTGAGLTPATGSAYTTDENDNIFLAIANASALVGLGGPTGGDLTVLPSARGGYGVYISATDPSAGATSTSDFINFVNKVKDAADTDILVRNDVSSDISLDANGLRELFIVVVNQLVEDLDTTDEATLATYEATVFPATIGFFDNFQPTLASLSVAYYGLELLGTGDFSPTDNSYDVSHTNFGGFTVGEGYIVTANEYAEVDGTTLITGGGIATTSTVTAASDTSVTLEVVISDDDATDANVYLDNTYTLNISLEAKTSLNDIAGLVSATDVTVDGTSVAGLVFEEDGDDTDNTRTLTYTNAGISFPGDSILSVTTGAITGIATVAPTADAAGVSSASITTDGSANSNEVRITLTEDFPTAEYTLLPNSVTVSPLELVYVLVNALNLREPPRNTVLDVRYAGVPLPPSTFTDAEPSFTYTLNGLFNLDGATDVSITYTIPAGYIFGPPVAPNNYDIDANNPLEATYTHTKPSGFGANTIPLADFITFSVVQVGAPDIYTYTVEGSFLENSSPVGPNDFNVTQDSVSPSPSATLGGLEVNGGVNEIPIELIGLTNRNDVGVMVELTLPADVTRHTADSSGHTPTGNDVISFEIADPDGAGEGFLASTERGRFVVESNSTRYDLVVSAAFAATVIPDAPTTNQILAALEGSFSVANPTDTNLDVAYNANTRTYAVLGLTNRASETGTLSIADDYSNALPRGFTLDATNATTIPDLDGAQTAAAPTARPFGTFTVTEDIYTANVQTYTISGTFAAQEMADPPLANQVNIGLDGSDPNIVRSNVDYNVTGLTNRDSVGVTIGIDISYANNVPAGFTLDDTGVTNIPAAAGADSIASATLGTFALIETKYPANVETYTIQGGFVAQESVIAPTAGISGEMNVALLGSSPSVELDDNTYTVSGLTNRVGEAVTIGLGSYALQTGFRFATALSATPYPTPDGNRGSNEADFATFTIEESAFPGNAETYIIRAAFAAQAPAPTPPADHEMRVDFTGSPNASATLSGNVYNVTNLTNRNVADGTLDFSSYTVADGFRVNPSNILTLADPQGEGPVAAGDIGSSLGTFKIEETAYPGNSETYTISGSFVAQPTLPSPPIATPVTATLEGSSNIVFGALTNNNYNITGLTNRDGKSVSLSTNAGFALTGTEATTFTLSDISTTSAATPNGVVASNIALATFTIKENDYPANIQTYTITGVFDAQPTLPAPPSAGDITPTLLGSPDATVSYDTNVYTITGLTNRTNGTLSLSTNQNFALSTADAALFTLSVLSSTSISTPPRAESASVRDLATFTIMENNYTNNAQTYTIRGEFAAQMTLPGQSATITYAGNMYSINSINNTVSVTYAAGEVARLISDSPNTDYQYLASTTASSAGVVIIPGSTSSSDNPAGGVTIEYSPTSFGTVLVARYVLRETAYPLNNVERSYTINF